MLLSQFVIFLFLNNNDKLYSFIKRKTLKLGFIKNIRLVSYLKSITTLSSSCVFKVLYLDIRGSIQFNWRLGRKSFMSGARGNILTLQLQCSWYNPELRLLPMWSACACSPCACGGFHLAVGRLLECTLRCDWASGNVCMVHQNGSTLTLNRIKYYWMMNERMDAWVGSWMDGWMELRHRAAFVFWHLI